MKRMNWVVLVLAGALLLGCENEEIAYEDGGPNNGRVIGTVHGRVLNAVDGSFLAGATIRWADDSGIHNVLADASGYYLVRNLEQGAYVFTVSTSGGYAVRSYPVIVPTLDQIGIVDLPTEEDFRHTLVQDLAMFPLTSSLSGRLFLENDQAGLVLGVGVDVILDFSADQISPALIHATTASDGLFHFTGLPATNNARLRIDAFQLNGLPYPELSTLVDLTPGGDEQLGDIRLQTLQVEPFVVSDNLNQGGVSIAAPLIITYNKAMRPSTFNASLQGASLVELHVSWSGDNRTVTLTPDEPLLLDRIYSLQLDGVAQDNSPYNETILFATQEGIEIASTNLQFYDGAFSILATDSIVIEYTEAVDPSSEFNVFQVDGTDMAVSLQDGNHSLMISPPPGGWVGNSIHVLVTAYSTLAPYDNASISRTVQIR
jgi:hypothetical protein